MSFFQLGLKFSPNVIKHTNEIFNVTSYTVLRSLSISSTLSSSSAKIQEFNNNIININGSDYMRDSQTNISPQILNYVGRNLHLSRNHPLNLLKQRIVNLMYSSYVNRRGNPLFSVYDKQCPVVTIEQNFDSLLIPADHPSRKKSDTYFVNSNYVLRTHTSAHQRELILNGLDNFLVIGDVYRRDQIDATHFPVFHQAEAVRLFSAQELYHALPNSEGLKLFDTDVRRPDKQECHSMEALKMIEQDLKQCLSNLVQRLFGSDTKYKWTDSYFPFTHPSWELEVYHNGAWLEVLGCGVVEQEILKKAGAGDKVGWAFGLGLERLAMTLYNIPDIRLFWSQDSGFLSQFDVSDAETPIKYEVVSKFPQCINDISFWVPEHFHPNDFYDIARSVGGDIIEQVHKVDEFFHPKKKRKSFCFRIIYRHMERTLTQSEVNEVHKEIEKNASKDLGVEIR